MKRPNSFLQNALLLLMLISCNGYVRCKSFTANSFQFSRSYSKKKRCRKLAVFYLCVWDACWFSFLILTFCRTLANVVLNFLLLKVSFCLEIIKECLLHFCNWKAYWYMIKIQVLCMSVNRTLNEKTESVSPQKMEQRFLCEDWRKRTFQ